MASAENLLGGERSPYLLQHAANPVHWRPWGAAALAEARAGNKPILLSIGYAACHWCHVMAHESFEDEQTAIEMNENFINIKVDREERPDIDHIYMSALQLMGRQGGWPLTMFLTPRGEAFWGGTYFPPVRRHGMPGFREVLAAIHAAWARDDEAIRQNRARLSQALAAMSAARPGPLPSMDRLAEVAERFVGQTDPVHGGLGGAPKFPNAPVFRFLWQEGICAPMPAACEATHALLARMSYGGIHDHLGGGYSRYATDAEWLVPHFEKMLYDNAQILELLALAQADRPDPLYGRCARGIVDWLTREMMAGPPDGRACFAASMDADSEGEEGRFYVWDAAEVAAIVGPRDADGFARAYDVSEAGNWEGRTILRRVSAFGDDAAEADFDAARAALFAARSGRVPPARDDKILADWNALMIAGLARAAAVFARPQWLALGGAAYDRLRVLLGRPDGRIDHSWCDGVVTAAGLLEDQAAMARAALALYEASGEVRYLDDARGLVAAAREFFADPDGGFFQSASDARDVPSPRPRVATDGAVPSGQGLMAEVLARLFVLTGEPEWEAAAEAVIGANAGAADGLAGSTTLLAAARLLHEAASVVVTGTGPGAAALVAVALAGADPTVAVVRAPPGAPLGEQHPAAGKPNDVVRAYVCRARVCGPPLDTAAGLARVLRARGLPA